ncbi:hypothetical protein PR048_007407 [Dryococelus australis]|uniref:Uncharacterized protein n=1 Tax=Dryococelus australis TaxID=614101 RepID=A0ABQ9HU67_9NEOP|nr:hypothetical protein PR048_007407 [Dryococelus australis]
MNPVHCNTLQTDCSASRGHVPEQNVYSAVRLHASQKRQIGYNHRPDHYRIFARGNRVGLFCWLAGFLGNLPFPLPLQSNAAPFTPHSTLIGSHDLVVKSRVYLSMAKFESWGIMKVVIGGGPVDSLTVREAPKAKFHSEEIWEDVNESTVVQKRALWILTEEGGGGWEALVADAETELLESLKWPRIVLKLSEKEAVARADLATP